MAAGFITKPLATLLATAARWVEFGDASTAPVHGSLILSPSTGLPLDTDAPALVQATDSKAVSGSLSAAGTFFVADMDGFDELTIDIRGTFSGAVVKYETSEDQTNWRVLRGIALNTDIPVLWTDQTGAAGPWRIPRSERYTRVSLVSITSGTVSITGNIGHQDLQPPMRSGDGNEVSHPHALPSRRWSYAAASGGLTTTTPATLRAATASQYTMLLSFSAVNVHASVDTEILLKEGTNIIFRQMLKAGGGRADCGFRRSSAVNTAMTVECVSNGAQVYVNADGYYGQ